MARVLPVAGRLRLPHHVSRSSRHAAEPALTLGRSWQGLHLIDLVIHVCEAVVPYGYIFIQAVFVVPRTLSDVLCLLGCCRVAARYCQMGPFPLFGLVPLSFFVLFFALAHTCMNFGLVFSWLGLVSPTVVHQVAKGRNGLEAGSAALQFVTALVLACITFDDLSQRNDYLYHGQRVSCGPHSPTYDIDLCSRSGNAVVTGG